MSGKAGVWEAAGRLREAGTAAVVVTVIAVRGSVPGTLGAKALISNDGILAGTLGGGKVEARALDEARKMLSEPSARCVTHVWNLQRDIGMTCGGEVSFLFELLLPEASWHVVVFGAGHVSQSLVRLLGTLCCRVDVVDEREPWLDRLPLAGNVRRRLVENFEDGVQWVEEGSFVVSITRGHSSDRPVLRELLKVHPRLPFVGVIGSASKRAVLMRELRKDGVSEEGLERLICPLGLPLGGNDPAEIAVSIAAQLLDCRGA